MLQHNPPLLSKREIGQRQWQIYFEVAGGALEGTCNIKQQDLIFPNGYRCEYIPNQVALFCELCGEIWGRIRFAGAEPLGWDSILRDCHRCGDGSMELTNCWHGYYKQINAAMPYEILIRELDIEINKSKEVLKCKSQW